MGFVLNCSDLDNALISLREGFRCTVPKLEKYCLALILRRSIQLNSIF